MQYSETEVHFYCDPLKHIMDNPIFIAVSLLYGKTHQNTKDFPESREKKFSTNKTTTFVRFVFFTHKGKMELTHYTMFFNRSK